ncbi:MAG: DUF6686 family protein [Aureispira sp.]
MCDHCTVARNSEGFVLWCEDCKIYRVHFNTIVLALDVKGLELFKSNLSICYQENSGKRIARDKRHIFLDTRLEGLQLWFSTEEVGSLLALLQEATLCFLTTRG